MGKIPNWKWDIAKDLFEYISSTIKKNMQTELLYSLITTYFVCQENNVCFVFLNLRWFHSLTQVPLVQAEPGNAILIFCYTKVGVYQNLTSKQNAWSKAVMKNWHQLYSIFCLNVMHLRADVYTCITKWTFARKKLMSPLQCWPWKNYVRHITT